MYVDDRLGYRGVVARLNAEGIPCPTKAESSGSPYRSWNIGTIRSMLLNGTYTGDTYWNRRSYAKFHRISDRHALERPRHRADKPDWNPQSDWFVVKGTHPAIISHEKYKAVLRRPRAGGNRSGKAADLQRMSKRSPYLLSGLLRCVCGHAFSGQVTTKARRKSSGEPVRTAYYLCGGYLQKGRKHCIRCAIPKDEMEARVWQMIECRLALFIGDCGTNRIRGRGTSEERISLLRAQIQRIEINPKEGRALVSWRRPSGPPVRICLERALTPSQNRDS
jgi:hypothetical protein